jgi:hypothetical protein
LLIRAAETGKRNHLADAWVQIISLQGDRVGVSPEHLARGGENGTSMIALARRMGGHHHDAIAECHASSHAQQLLAMFGAYGVANCYDSELTLCAADVCLMVRGRAILLSGGAPCTRAT